MTETVFGVQVVHQTAFRPEKGLSEDNKNCVRTYGKNIIDERFCQDFNGVMMKPEDCTWGVRVCTDDIVQIMRLKLQLRFYPDWLVWLQYWMRR
jgi:hypothetical protein